MSKSFIVSENAPAAIGTYSQAVKAGDFVFLSGQIALDPKTMTMQNESISHEIRQVFSNLKAVCVAAGGGLQDVVKLTAYLIDLGNFAIVNKIMQEYFKAPYPARAAIGVSELPKQAAFEVDAIIYLPN
jgi:reactive intermediate/imine deaminase